MVETIKIEFLGNVSLYFGLGIEILTAVFLGGLVGLDREQKRKAAGIKTNVLICLGATLYTAISMINVREVTPGAVLDPNRVAAQIVSGIGFLGAGAILHGGVNVVGLTTAATIWVVAAIGVTVGSGRPFIATIFTITVWLVLKLLNPFYRLVAADRDWHVEFLSIGSIKDSVRQVLHRERILANVSAMFEETLGTKKDRRVLHLYMNLDTKRLEDLMRQLHDIVQVEKIHYHACAPEAHQSHRKQVVVVGEERPKQG